MDKEAFSRRIWEIFITFLAALIVFAFILKVFDVNSNNLAGNGGISQNETGQLLLQRVEDLENRIDALVNNRLPQKIEFCGEHVPQEKLYVRERLEKELIFLSRKQFTLYIKRSQKYFPYIEKRLNDLNLPDCLKYVAVIESALMPQAFSSAKAYGIWQFIDGTAKRYGLKKGLNYDERANFEKATDAALNYFKDNYKQFKSWALAIAAYNAGENNIELAIKLQKTNDYYELFLPPETMQYNYRAIIASLVISHPERFGFSLKDADLYEWPDVEEKVYSISNSQSVFEIARHFKISVNELLWLNPWIKTPSGKKLYREKVKNFILPKGTYKFKVPAKK